MKIPTNQLSLDLTFTNPPPSVLRTLATLMEIADTSDNHVSRESGFSLRVPRHSEGAASDPYNPQVKPDQTLLRKRLRQLAGCAAIARKMEWHTVWVEAYHQFFKETGKHPVVESVRLGLPTHLDYVFTDPSWPGVLHNVLEKMLTEAKP